METARNPLWFQAFGQFGLLASLICAFVLPPFFGSSTYLLHLFVMISLTFVLLTVLPFKRQVRLLAPLVFIEFFATTYLTISDTGPALMVFYATSSVFFGSWCFCS